MLSVRDVTLRFGGIVALDGVSFEVARGTVSGLIGPNGAGKTTAFNVITRLYAPDAGDVELDGESLLRTPPHGVVRRGVARTFQNINLFRTMSVLENVLVGGHSLGRRGVRRRERGGARWRLRGARLARRPGRPPARGDRDGRRRRCGAPYGRRRAGPRGRAPASVAVPSRADARHGAT